MIHACGANHAVLIQHGKTLALGDLNGSLPESPSWAPGVTFTQAAAGPTHTALLCSDGDVIVSGGCFKDHGNYTLCNDCVQVAAGARHTVLLRNDGRGASASYHHHRWPRICRGIGV